MKPLYVAVAFLTVCSLTQVARADDAVEDYERPGPYLGIGASRSINLIEGELDNTSTFNNVTVDDSWGVNARGGYRVNKFIALEGEYEYLGNWDVHGSLSGFGFDAGRIQVSAATGNMKVFVPLDRFEPYLLIGAGAAFVGASHGLQGTHTNFAGRVGIGIDIYVSNNVYVNLGGEGLLSNAEIPGAKGNTGVNTVNLQFGLGYRF